MGKEKRYPLYLLVADQTNEFDVALHYAAKAALFNGARLAVLCIMPESDKFFMPLRSMSEDIEAGKRAAAEEFLQGVSAKLNAYDITPALYLRSGKPTVVIRELVNSDKGITQLILAGDTHTSNPGSLVSYFTRRGLKDLNVPLTIVPSHLTDDITKHFFEQID